MIYHPGKGPKKGTYRKALCMKIKNNRAEILANKWLNKEITPEEEQEFHVWYSQNLDLPVEIPADFVGSEEEHRQRILNSIQNAIDKPARKVWPRIVAAASIILGLFIGSYILIHTTESKQTAQIQKQDIAPGSNKAVLILANGQQIILSDAKNGHLAQQGSAIINKTANGQVVYNTLKNSPTGGNSEETFVYNTMTTPRGGQYHLTLADGTNVWLNAASSIRYPTAFTGKVRLVEVTGEAYFEVAHIAAKSFRVISKNQAIEVLGTHFNVNTYEDEPATITTLLEGSVKISSIHSSNSSLLKPGEQAEITTEGIKVMSADIEEAVSWKNGDFVFNNQNIKSIMRSLSRWYQLDVIYQGPVSQELFYAKISRFKNISQVLKMLEKTKAVHFKIEGRRVIVIK